VRVDEVPITPEKVLRALADRISHRVGPKTFPRIDWPAPLRVPTPLEGGDGNAANEGPRRRREGAIVAPEVATVGLAPHPSTPEGRDRRPHAGTSEGAWPEVLP
jgi:hypothetical protein